MTSGPTRVLVALLVGGLVTGCGTEAAAPGGTVPPETTARPGPTTSTAREDSASSTTRVEEPAAPDAQDMLSAAQELFAAMERHDFSAAAGLFVDDWTFESFGGGTLTSDDGDDLVDVLGFNGTILSFEPGTCEADETGELAAVRCPDNRVHGPLPAALGIDQPFPMPLDLLFARDGRLVGVVPDRAALERHPEAAATVVASSRIGLDLTSWIAETEDDSSTLLRAPGRAIVPTTENAHRLVELAHEFVARSG